MTTRDVQEPDAGSALLVALLVSTLLCGLGLGLVLVGDTETLVASNYDRRGGHDRPTPRSSS